MHTPAAALGNGLPQEKAAAGGFPPRTVSRWSRVTMSHDQQEFRSVITMLGQVRRAAPAKKARPPLHVFSEPVVKADQATFAAFKAAWPGPMRDEAETRAVFESRDPEFRACCIE